MDKYFRSDKRAAWQASTPLKQRWIVSGVLFVIVLLVLILISVL